MSNVIHTPRVVEEGQDAQPSTEEPFVVVTRASQPVDLIVLHPFAGVLPSPGVKTTAIIVMPEGKIDPEALRKKAESALDDAPDAEGVVLVGGDGEVQGVLSTADVLSGLGELLQELRMRDYEPLLGPKPDVQVSLVYICPIPGCTSPEVTLYQKGQDVPPCPIHNRSREPKYAQE